MNIKSFIKGSGILIISNVILKAMNFFLMPIYTKYLSAEMLGVSDTVTSFTGLLFPILMMGLDSAFSAFYYDKGEKQAEKVFSTIAYTLLILGSIPLVLSVFASRISLILFQTTEYSLIVIFALASVTFNIWYMPFALNIRMKNKMFMYGMVNMFSSFCMIMLNIIFVVFLNLGTVSLILSSMIVHVIQLVLFAVLNRAKVCMKYFDVGLLKKMFIFAIPLVPGVILSWVLALSDRYMLLHLRSVADVGLYGVGTRLVTVLNIFISSVTMAYTTFAYGSKNDVDAKEKYVKVFDVLVLVLVCICFTISLFGKEVIEIMTAPEYYQSYVIVRDLFYAQMFYGITSIVGYGILFEKKPVFTLLANCLGAVVNVILNFIFIPQYGISAAAATTLLGYLVTFLSTYIFSQRLYKCNYKVKKAFVALGITYVISRIAIIVGFGMRIAIWGIVVVGMFVLYRDVIISILKILVSERKGK